MKTISKRLQALEKLLAHRVENEEPWGDMARLRDEILRRAALQGGLSAAEMKQQLDALGPRGLWLEVVRGCLSDSGFVQASDESFAETMARALSIDTDQLRLLIAQGQIGPALQERFGTGDTCR